MTLQTHSMVIHSRCCPWAACPHLHTAEQSITQKKEVAKSVTLRSLWMMGVLRWCRRETASQVSQKICSTSASVKPVCSLWFIKLTTCPPAKQHPVIQRLTRQGKLTSQVYNWTLTCVCYSFKTLILLQTLWNWCLNSKCVSAATTHLSLSTHPCRSP